MIGYIIIGVGQFRYGINLRMLGFDVTNDIFAENAWYFRNSLVRANYNDVIQEMLNLARQIAAAQE